MITTVITAHRYNKHKLVVSYLSARKHGPVVITLTAVNAADIRKIKRHCPEAKLVINVDSYSNAQWIAGVNAVTTKYTHLIHDGDVVVTRPAVPSGDVMIGEAINLNGAAFRFTELVHPGVSVTDIYRLLSRFGTKTLSPGRGIFRTDLLLKSLRSFEYYTSPTLVVNESLVVGNDLHIWLDLPDNAIISPLKFPVIAFDTEDSTTVRADSSAYHKLERLYDAYRHKAGVARSLECIPCLYTGKDDKLDYPNTHKFDNTLTTFPANPTKPAKDIWATMAWHTAIAYAHDMGYDQMLWLENDCWIKKGVNLTPAYHQLQEGTVCCWGWLSAGKEFYRSASQPYVLREGNGQARPAVYCNGALAFYNVDFHYHLFYQAGLNNIEAIAPFDLHTGYMLYDIYREDVFRYVRSNPYIYSDCGDHHITIEQRQQLTSTVHAIHKNPYLL